MRFSIPLGADLACGLRLLLWGILPAMIKAIVFDYGGVIEISNANLVRDIREVLGVEKEVWYETYFSYRHLHNIENKSFGELLVTVSEKLGGTSEQMHTIKQMIEDDAVNRFINTELIAYIKELQKNYRVALLSNYATDLREKLLKLSIVELFETVIISGEVGYQKPDPQIFRILCEKMEIKPEEFVFIDDSFKSLEGAEEIGYTPILFTSNKQLKEDLEKILS